MYSDISYAQHIVSQSGHGPTSASGNARRLAAGQFWMARLSAAWNQLWNRVSGRNRHLVDLNEATHGKQSARRRFAGIKSVPLSKIIGSEGRSLDFDASFRPTVSHIRDRWVGIAAARIQGVVLPPVSLVKLGDHYFVRDGNHRISVAQYLEQSEIDAEVTIWETA